MPPNEGYVVSRLQHRIIIIIWASVVSHPQVTECRDASLIRTFSLVVLEACLPEAPRDDKVDVLSWREDRIVEEGEGTL